jgi:hypothetical protein
MKKVLLSCTLLFAIATFSKVNAQCNIGIPNITNAVTSSTADSCFVTFDLSFAMKNNNGNKIIGIDFWQGTSYVAPSYASVPSLAELSNSLGSLMINNNFSSSPINVTFLFSYPSGSSVRLLTHGAGTRTYNASVDSFYFALTGIKIGAPRAGDNTCPVSLLTVKGNVWSTNSNSYNANTLVQCYSGIGFSLGNPTIPTASANCISKKLNFSIATTSATSINVSYKIFKDDNVLVGGTPVFNTSTDIDITPAGTQPVTISSSAPYSSSTIDYPVNGFGYWVVVYYTGLDLQTYSVSKYISTCPASTLPVTFKSFSASRSNQTVAIKWETAFEQDNRGFYVQRNVNGEWKDIAFVFSKAENGNSSGPLSYMYNDPNNLNTVSYYRVLQVDLNGLGKFSQVRVIRGQEISDQLKLFPNPGTNGKVNVLFNDETSAKNVIVYDASGRAVKSFRNIVSASLTIDQLKPGIYNIQVVNITSQTVSSEKFIIKD